MHSLESPKPESSMKKRRGSFLGLDSSNRNILPSPSKRACKMVAPLKERTLPIQPPRLPFSFPVFLSNSVHFPSWTISLFVCCFKFFYFIPFLSPDVEVGHLVLDVRGPWTAEIQPVQVNWRMEKCSRFGLEAHFTDFLPDEQLFTMTQNIPPFKTLPVPMDGNCFFRFVVIPMLTPFQPMHGLTETFCPYQLHLQNSLGFI